MDPLALHVADVATVGGASIVVAILVELVKRTFGLSPAAVDRFAPAIAVVLGVVLGSLAAAASGLNVGDGALAGLVAGALSGGVYNAASALRGVAIAPAATPRPDSLPVAPAPPAALPPAGPPALGS